MFYEIEAYDSYLYNCEPMEKCCGRAWSNGALAN